MTITEEVREAIRRTCLEERGGALKLARKAGFEGVEVALDENSGEINLSSTEQQLKQICGAARGSAAMMNDER